MECKMKRCKFCRKERKEYMFYTLKNKEGRHDRLCYKCRPYYLKGRTLDKKARIWVRKEETQQEIKRRLNWHRYYLLKKEQKKLSTRELASIT